MNSSYHIHLTDMKTSNQKPNMKWFTLLT